MDGIHTDKHGHTPAEGQVSSATQDRSQSESPVFRTAWDYVMRKSTGQQSSKLSQSHQAGSETYPYPLREFDPNAYKHPPAKKTLSQTGPPGKRPARFYQRRQSKSPAAYHRLPKTKVMPGATVCDIDAKKTPEVTRTSGQVGDSTHDTAHFSPAPTPTPNLGTSQTSLYSNLPQGTPIDSRITQVHALKQVPSTTAITQSVEVPRQTTEVDQSESPQPGEKTPPATYETLKRAGETPEQVIARLQEEGRREVGMTMLRRNVKGEPITTALNTLDFLRKPLPRDKTKKLPDASQPTAPIEATNFSQGSQPNATNFQDQFQSTTNLNQSQSLRGGWGGSTDNNPTERQQERPSGTKYQNSFQTQTIQAPQQTWIDQCPQLNWNGQGPHSTWSDPSKPQTLNDQPQRSAWNDVPPPSNHQARPNTPDIPDRSSRWATKEEMKPPSIKVDSNSDEEPESDLDSVKPMAKGFGRLIRSGQPEVPEYELVGWDGNFQPPPLDWEQRPRFHNNTEAYISGFDGWLGATTVSTMSQKSAPEINFRILPSDQLQNLDNQADGIGFVPKDVVVINNDRYGHRLAAPAVTDPEFPLDYEAQAILDLKDPQNARYRHETAQMFIDRQMAHIERAQREAQAEMLRQQQFEREQAAMAAEEPQEERPTPPPFKSNIYLRPAVRADIPGMTSVYNWHVTTSVRPSELAEISEEDMEGRLNMTQGARLPFIVAVERTRRNARAKPRRSSRVNPSHPVQNTDPYYSGVVKDEPIVGWASATDWSASDYVETTTAELEVYVAAGFRKTGVGRCLMDAILDATDRGYIKKGGYDFHVAPEIKHMYSTGGGRDLHKLIFQVRSFNKPFTPEQLYRNLRAAQVCGTTWTRHERSGNLGSSPNARAETEKDFSKEARLDDREDDYTIWLKEWLERYGFEEEAHLKKMGTKKQRWIDVRYLSRETSWQPNEGRVPDFMGGI